MGLAVCNTFFKKEDSKLQRTKQKVVDLSQRFWQAAVQIVSKPPAPTKNTRFTVFGQAEWLALLLIKAGDVKTNPGPTTTHKQIWICDICHKQIHGRKQISIRCNRIEHWVHRKMRRYPPITIYRYLDLPSTQRIRTHRHNTNPPFQTLVQAPHPLPTYTTATQIQTHIKFSPCSHRIGKPQIQSSYQPILSPPTPPRDKQIHISHTPPNSSSLARQLR